MKRLMKPWMPAVALAVAALSLTGCFERTEKVSINPDGSGKAVIEMLVPPPPDLGMGQPAPGPKELAVMAQKGAQDMITKTTGVDAWKDVSYEVNKDGLVVVKATAYFPDVSAFKSDVGPKLKWEKKGEGEYELSYVIDKKPADSQPDAPKMTDAEVAEKVKQERAQFKQAQPFMKMMFESLKIETTYSLPGTIKSTNILTKKSDNTASLTIEGKKMLEAMDKAMSDDKQLEAQIRSGKKASDDPEVMTEAMFGKKGALSVTVGGATKPLFDYKAEMAVAKAAQAEMFKKLSIDPDAKASVPMNMDPAPGQ